MDYITVSTTGNATDFGDLSSETGAPAAVGSSTRGLFAGGVNAASPYVIDTIEYITIATTGDVTDFGDLTDQLRS